jgi:hypothetical protein
MLEDSAEIQRDEGLEEGLARPFDPTGKSE